MLHAYSLQKAPKGSQRLPKAPNASPKSFPKTPKVFRKVLSERLAYFRASRRSKVCPRSAQWDRVTSKSAVVCVKTGARACYSVRKQSALQFYSLRFVLHTSCTCFLLGTQSSTTRSASAKSGWCAYSICSRLAYCLILMKACTSTERERKASSFCRPVYKHR